MSGQQGKTEDRTCKYGGDDDAMENERAGSAPGADPGTTGTPTGRAAKTGKTQPERKLDKDLETGEENPA